MAEEELQVVQLQKDFYRDGFSKLLLIIIGFVFVVALLGLISLRLYLEKPAPETFPVDAEWRVQPEVPLSQPYMPTPDLLQWVNDSIQKAFTLDFYNYNDQLKNISQFFTQNGWQAFLNQLNIYANYNNVQAYKMFINATPTSAPIILQQGLLSGVYGWWVQMPIDINYASYTKASKQSLLLQMLVVRVSTLNNLSGVGIENVIVANKSSGTSLSGQ
jgi:intracellular multiplication protein IcmL